MRAGLGMRLSIAIAGILLAGATAGAQFPGGGGGMGAGEGFGEHRPPFERAFGEHGEHGRWWNNPRIVAELKLTDAQRKSMDETLLAHREKLIDLRASLEKAELAMEPLMKDDQPNETRILAQIDQVAQARAELEKANARFLLAIRSKLTPEQWKQLQANHEHLAEHGRGGFGRNGEGREGWRQGDQGPGMQRPGGQYHHPQPAPGQAAPQGAPPATPGPPASN